jgi:hypothetical protein
MALSLRQPVIAARFRGTPRPRRSFVPVNRANARDVNANARGRAMQRYEPQDPRANEPGDHPPNAERKGNWRVVLTAVGLAHVAIFVLLLIYWV